MTVLSCCMNAIAYSNYVFLCFALCIFPFLVDRSLKRRQVKPLAASLLDALDYDSSDDSDFEVGDASGKYSLHNVWQPYEEFWYC